MDETWAPEACTLPTAERPFRVAEFDDLFATHLRRSERVDPQTLDLTLNPESRATVEDLTARETECCSFFTFTLTGTTELHLRITVPPTQTAVLDGLLA
ncbi:hypothetical protein [Kribbella sindirgiensis]|uniref:Arsenate reductase n=1 Tax=Kribbella sindirgiensis TaxID=1124744 RepID=A0A4R0IHU5_9ACTN|nr:hypothetical protein [Kribbella sindirgiensis]TCC30608.1 hypothetical protein E0H50_24765 [Kribbella sindirgiensis]